MKTEDGRIDFVRADDNSVLVALQPGWKFGDGKLVLHMLALDSEDEAAAVLRDVQPCLCQRCRT